MSDDGYPLELPPGLQGRDLNDIDPAEFGPSPLSQKEGAAQLAALGDRITDGELAGAERAELIARLNRQGWTQQEIAAAAGISQAAVSKSLRATPGARALETSRSGCYLAGRMIGLAGHLCRGRRDMACERQAGKLAGERAPVTDITLGRLRHLLGKDLARPGVPAAYREELAQITARLDEAGGVPPQPWTLAQRAEVVLAQHHQSAALTRATDRVARAAGN